MNGTHTLIEAIDALLPQTQCGKCGHPGCLPYAEGMAQGEALNKCPPGGASTVQALAELLQRPPMPLAQAESPPQVAVIREAECIGCTKCIQACPVDAIVGAAKLMHTVIRDECSGCELCLPPCPVDCIDLLPLQGDEASRQRQRAGQYRRRHQAHLTRRQREAKRRQPHPAQPGTTLPTPPAGHQADEHYKRLKIDAAMARVVLGKAERQFAQHGSAALRQQVEELRRAAEEAQQALDAANAPPPSDGLVALKQAKIQLAMRRAELSRAERQGLDEATLQSLRQALEHARQALHSAEENSGKPAPVLQRIDKNPHQRPLRELKTELAYARADLKRLERRGDADPATLAAARQRLDTAEQRLHEQSAD